MLRNKILSLLRFIPDKTMLKIQYRIKTGRKLDLKTPKRFSEKLQWYKLHYRTPLMVECVDKYDVRNYIERCGYAHLLTKCYGIFSSAEEIDFELLPSKFVIKATLGGGGNSVMIVRDKASLNVEETKKTINKWFEYKTDKKGAGREWPYYSGKKNRIIIEEYIEELADTGLVDYKFLCFHGKVQYMYLACERELGNGAKFGFYDRNMNKLEITRSDEFPLLYSPPLPQNMQEMISIAEDISKEFPHARIDLYNIKGKIMFGEITFFDGSGYLCYDPDEFDFVLGEYFNIDFGM